MYSMYPMRGAHITIDLFNQFHANVHIQFELIRGLLAVVRACVRLSVSCPLTETDIVAVAVAATVYFSISK